MNISRVVVKMCTQVTNELVNALLNVDVCDVGDFMDSLDNESDMLDDMYVEIVERTNVMKRINGMKNTVNIDAFDMFCYLYICRCMN
jgi:hypothetical protein